jgi:tetratricopeptide (TPR) repeat protein
VTRSRQTICLWACAGVLLTVGLPFLYGRLTARSPERLVAEARRKLARGQYAEAEALARQALAGDSHHGGALLVAADAAASQKHLEAALKYYLQVPDDCSPALVEGQYGAGQILVDQGRLSEGEQKFRRALACDPGHRNSHIRLAYVLGITGRRWESVEHMLTILRSGHFPGEYLIFLGDVERVVERRRVLTRCRAVAPEDPLPLLGEARIAVVMDDLPEARRLLERVVASLPNENEAQARLGSMLLDMNEREEFNHWLARLPPAADAHPGIWMVRGLWFWEQNDLPTAARCFWEAVLRDPDHRQANYRLGTTLAAMKDPARAAPFFERAERLEALMSVIDELFRNNHDTQSMAQASALAEALGRTWEAWGWALLARGEDPRLDWAEQTIARLKPRLTPDLPRTLPERNPARQIDLSSFPLPGRTASAGPATPRPGDGQSQVQIRYADVAAAAGIQFVYFNSRDSSKPSTRIFESTGGGVAALDFDGDAWPDLYFTQGCRQPPVGPREEHRDRLFRNLGDGRAADVTEAAGLGDERFSQGISAGDCNNDGFPDLYLANIGGNRLYRNNGDGTFTETTAPAGIHGNDWTTSCLIADLNGDSWPDIYDVNFCAGPDVFTLLCGKKGAARACSPQAFDAAPDRVYLNRGDGTFEEVTESAGISAPNGYGLGIVAADFEGTGRLNLFIANDGTANFYFVNHSDRRDGKLRFVEQALVAGLAFDADGLPQACMGVAAGDADGNGLMDLHVTNFYNESDTLYLQQPGGGFVDMTRAASLREPSYEPLGFGTQFLDGDLDGMPDLVVTNGHVDDLRSAGQPYEMSPQFYRNVGGGRFVELPASSLGEFFERKYLGRGLARLDWDRDGKEDFAVSHIGSPAALVVNRTPRVGHFLALQFRGVACDRDAIGTTVQITAGGRTLMSQLTAGDGYQASNERRLVMGLGNASHIDKLVVRWLSGVEQTFSNVAPDRDVMLVEGRAELVSMPGK